MASVYIETTIPSCYFETRTSPKIATWRSVTREWWDRHRHNYELATSRYVLEELGNAPESKAIRTTTLLKDVPILQDPPRLLEVVEYYLQHKLMPNEIRGDVFHLAMASLHAIDYLLTWNCRHLANTNKIRHLSVLNDRLKLPVPVIVTPLTLTAEVPQ